MKYIITANDFGGLGQWWANFFRNGPKKTFGGP